MTKQSKSNSGTSRIRFIVLEAEIQEGDLSQITSAIQNALKPTTTVVQHRLPSQPAMPHVSGGASGEAEFDGETIDAIEEESSQAPAPRPRETRVRKPTSMEVLDIDLVSHRSLENYASEHVPKTDTERNLVALAWFKEHRPSVIVTPNHIYTCYRAMKWPAGIDDFPGVLRKLKSQKIVKSTGRGQYEINHLSIARVEKLGSSN